MLRIVGISGLSIKTAIELIGLAAIALSTYVIIHQLHHAAATASSHGQAHTLLNASNLNADTSDQSDQGGTTSNSSSTKLTINGQDIPVPQNGTVSQTIPSENGSTHVELNNQQSSSSSSGKATNNSSTTINVHNSSSSSSTQGGSQ